MLGASDGRFRGAGISVVRPLVEVLDDGTLSYTTPRLRTWGSGAVLGREEDGCIEETFIVSGLAFAEPDTLLFFTFSTSWRGSL
jgi:hypothetical protein